MRRQTRLWRRLGALTAVAAISLGLLMTSQSAAMAAPAGILAYRATSVYVQDYTKFGAAAGRPVTNEDTALPADLSPFACVVLNIPNTAFTGAQVTTFMNYLNGGGTVVALGENSNPVFTAGNANLTALSTALGAGMTIVPATHGGQVNSTLIDPSPLTVGVTTFGYAASSEITASPPGMPLVHVTDGATPPMMGAAFIGNGVFVLAGDINGLSDDDVGAYATADEGKFAANLCALRSTGTSVSCASNLTVGTASDCTVTVTDTRVGGRPTAPTGNATLSNSGGVLANGGVCTLAAAATPGTSSCKVAYTPSASGTQTFSASYPGDIRHDVSNGQVSASVASAVPGLPAAGKPAGDARSPLGLIVALVALSLAGARAAAWRIRGN